MRFFSELNKCHGSMFVNKGTYQLWNQCRQLDNNGDATLTDNAPSAQPGPTHPPTLESMYFADDSVLEYYFTKNYLRILHSRGNSRKKAGKRGKRKGAESGTWSRAEAREQRGKEKNMSVGTS